MNKTDEWKYPLLEHINSQKGKLRHKDIEKFLSGIQGYGVTPLKKSTVHNRIKKMIKEDYLQQEESYSYYGITKRGKEELKFYRKRYGGNNTKYFHSDEYIPSISPPRIAAKALKKSKETFFFLLIAYIDDKEASLLTNKNWSKQYKQQENQDWLSYEMEYFPQVFLRLDLNKKLVPRHPGYPVKSILRLNKNPSNEMRKSSFIVLSGVICISDKSYLDKVKQEMVNDLLAQDMFWAHQTLIPGTRPSPDFAGFIDRNGERIQLTIEEINNIFRKDKEKIEKMCTLKISESAIRYLLLAVTNTMNSLNYETFKLSTTIEVSHIAYGNLNDDDCFYQHSGFTWEMWLREMFNMNCPEHYFSASNQHYSEPEKYLDIKPKKIRNENISHIRLKDFFERLHELSR